MTRAASWVDIFIDLADAHVVLPPYPTEIQDMKGFFTTRFNLASRRRERSVEATTLSTRGTMEQHIGAFTATREWVDQKQPKSIEIRDNPKSSKGSHHLRGNLFWWIKTILVLNQFPLVCFCTVYKNRYMALFCMPVALMAVLACPIGWGFGIYVKSIYEWIFSTGWTNVSEGFL